MKKRIPMEINSLSLPGAARSAEAPAAPTTISRVSHRLAVAMPTRTLGYPTLKPWFITTKLCTPIGKAVSSPKSIPKSRGLTP
jgi:hypothetical protein